MKEVSLVFLYIFLAICDTRRLERTIFVNFISQCLLTVFFILIYCFIFYDWAGFTGNMDTFEEDLVWFTTGFVAFIIFLVYKIVWGITFFIFYGEEVPLCLGNGEDPAFEKINSILKSILGIEVIGFILSTGFLVFMPVYVLVCYWDYRRRNVLYCSYDGHYPKTNSTSGSTKTNSSDTLD